MAEIFPFRGLRFDPARVDPQPVVCPPYDVIGAAEAAALRRSSPYNAVHVELPEPAGGLDRYRAAAALLDVWEREGALARDAEPSLYLTEQVFTGPDGWERTRRGFVCRLRLEDLGARVVLPHEKTHAGPKQDRLELLRATHAT